MKPVASRYAVMAEDNWRASAPDQYRALKHKAAFFAELGEEAQRQIDETIDSVPPVEGETFIQRARRMQAAQQMAEEIVGRELLTPPAPPEETLDPATGIPLPPPESAEDRALREALTDFQAARAEWQQTTPGPLTTTD